MTYDIAMAQALEKSANLVREYAGSEANKASSKLIEILIESYKIDLVTTTPELLPGIQSKIQQLLALRRCLLGEDSGIPRV